MTFKARTCATRPNHVLSHTHVRVKGQRCDQVRDTDKNEKNVRVIGARLTKKQGKFLVLIRPHLAARLAWNEATSTLDDLASIRGATIRDTGGPRSRWAQTYASYPRTSAKERRMTTIDGTVHTSALAPAADTVRK